MRSPATRSNRVRSCTDSFFESRTRPCLLYQIRRCSGPCTGEIDFPGYTELVREATDFLSGRSRAVKQELAAEMERASANLAFETAALYRDLLPGVLVVQPRLPLAEARRRATLRPVYLTEDEFDALHPSQANNLAPDHILDVGPLTLGEQSDAVARLWRTGG